MKRLSLCLALICLLAGSLSAVQDQAPKDNVWRLLSSQYHESWQDPNGPEEDYWESSQYYYDPDEPLQLDSLVTLDYSMHYNYYNYPDHTVKESLIFGLPGYLPGGRTEEVFSLDGQLLIFTQYESQALDSVIYSRRVYTYDVFGNNIQIIEYTGPQSSLTPWTLIRNTYNSDNQLLRRVIYRVVDASLLNLLEDGSLQYIYNNAGLKVERYSRASIRTDVWYRTQYSYNDDLLLINETTADSADSLSWNLNAETITSYTLVSGVFRPYQIRRSFYSVDEGTWVWKYTNTHSYSNDGLNETVISTYPDPNAIGMRTIVYNSGMKEVSGSSSFSSDSYSSYADWENVWDQPLAIEDPGLPIPDLKLGAYPNPFNPKTTVHYELKSRGKVVLALYNLRGQRLKRLVDAVQEPGARAVELLLNSSELGSGVYFLRLEAEGSTESIKILLLK